MNAARASARGLEALAKTSDGPVVTNNGVRRAPLVRCAAELRQTTILAGAAAIRGHDGGRGTSRELSTMNLG